ncbi:MAG: hypothetical protein ABW185_17045, partial [Sedimenticola sp.]
FFRCTSLLEILIVCLYFAPHSSKIATQLPSLLFISRIPFVGWGHVAQMARTSDSSRYGVYLWDRTEFPADWFRGFGPNGGEVKWDETTTLLPTLS